MALKNFPIKWCCFRGRASRAEFVWNLFAYALMLPMAYLFMGVLGAMSPLGGLLGAAVILAVWLTWLGAGVRRLHDCGRSSWWIAIPVLPSLLISEEIVSLQILGSFQATALLDHPVWNLFWTISLVGVLLFLFYLLVRKGMSGSNRYGPDPLVSAEDRAGKPDLPQSLIRREDP